MEDMAAEEQRAEEERERARLHMEDMASLLAAKEPEPFNPSGLGCKC